MTDTERSRVWLFLKRAWRRDVEPRDPWPIRWALVLTIVGGLVSAVLLTAAGFLVFGWPGVENPDRLKPSELFDLLKLAFVLIGGIGGAVALVVAYRKQKVHEQENFRAKRAEQRENTKLFNERFGAASAQLGHEKAAVRLAGVYSLAGLADDWKEQRQTCIDVLCAYLRMPYDPDAESASHPKGEKEVRHTILRIVRDHLRDPDALNSWCGRDFDFTGAVFDGGRLDGAQFTGGDVFFTGAKFTGGTVHFNDAQFAGGNVYFGDAEFTDGTVSFYKAAFTGGDVSFLHTKFAGGYVSFYGAKFAGGDVSFIDTKFAGGTVSFGEAEFTDGTVSFYIAKFTGSTVSFGEAEFTGGTVSFGKAKFTDGTVIFNGAKFTGSTVYFHDAEFTGGAVDLSAVGDYRTPPRFDTWDRPPAVADYRTPPQFDTWDQPPPGLRLPTPRTSTSDDTEA